MANNYCVYAHQSPSGKLYIGITCQKPNRRWHAGSGYRNQPHFYNAIKKYGWDNFQHEVLLEGISKENACGIEQYLIETFHTNNPDYGYNYTSGGECGYTMRPTEETRRKISEKLKSKPKSKEHREKIINQLSKCREARQRKVRCVETDEIFNSIKEAATKYHTGMCHIVECCRGKRKTAAKYHWEYWEVS